MGRNIRRSVCFIFRKKDPIFFSIEKVFSVLIPALGDGFDVTVRSVPDYSSSFAAILKNIRAVKKYKAAVYHVTGDIHYTVAGLPWTRTVLTIHDCIFLQHSSGMKKLLLKWIWLTWPVRLASIVTTISEKSKKEIIEYTGCRPEKVIVIPNPVSGNIYYREKEFNEICPIILFIGSTPNKNLDRVITALEGIECKLQIIGKIGVQQAEMLERSKIDYETMERIPEEVLADRYAACDLVLFPSTYEGFGLPIPEAQKAGRPLITSDLSPMKEVAGGAACLVDPFSIDAIRAGILRVARDRSYREELVKKGLENVRRYDKVIIAEQYLTCYKKLIKQ